MKEETKDEAAMWTPAERGEIAGTDAAFLPEDRMNSLRAQWNDVQAEFVDNPREAVEDAQNLVTKLVDELTDTFRKEREGLEKQWNSGENADTEALRTALQRYRSFFNRLLAVK